MLAPGLYPAACSLTSSLPRQEDQGSSVPVEGGMRVSTQGGLALGHIPYPSND